MAKKPTEKELWIAHIKWLLGELDRCESTAEQIKRDLTVYSKLLNLKIDIEARTVET